MAAALKARHTSHAIDAYNFQADIVKTLRLPIRRDASTGSNARNAVFGLTLTVALYSYVARSDSRVFAQRVATRFCPLAANNTAVMLSS